MIGGHEGDLLEWVIATSGHVMQRLFAPLADRTGSGYNLDENQEWATWRKIEEDQIG